MLGVKALKMGIGKDGCEKDECPVGMVAVDGVICYKRGLHTCGCLRKRPCVCLSVHIIQNLRFSWPATLQGTGGQGQF